MILDRLVKSLKWLFFRALIIFIAVLISYFFYAYYIKQTILVDVSEAYGVDFFSFKTGFYSVTTDIGFRSSVIKVNFDLSESATEPLEKICDKSNKLKMIRFPFDGYEPEVHLHNNPFFKHDRKPTEDFCYGNIFYPRTSTDAYAVFITKKKLKIYSAY